MSGMTAKNVEDRVRRLVDEVHELVEGLHHRAPQDASFEQVGILDGRETVLEFLAHGELGCAVEHLLYVVDESAITLSTEQAQGVEGLRRWLSASR